MTNSFATMAAELAWSLWSELGVPGLYRRHRGVVVDPEPLVVFSPWIMEHDKRLRDAVYAWTAGQSQLFSVSRLRGLLRRAPAAVHSPFYALSETLATAGKTMWPRGRGATPWLRTPEHTHTAIDATRPALLRVRLRALCGVGARADVLTELLMAPEAWKTASDLQGMGYAKRNAARILSELAEAGFVRSKPIRNALAFQLDQPRVWRALTGADGLASPDWMSVFTLICEATALAAAEDKSPSLQRVTAAKMRPSLEILASELGLDRPPEVRGEPEGWPLLLAWCMGHLEAMASGESPVFNAA